MIFRKIASFEEAKYPEQTFSAITIFFDKQSLTLARTNCF